MNDAPPFLNVEYWFRVIYELFANRNGHSFDYFMVIAAHVWQVITFVAYGVSLAAIAFLVYVMIQVRHLAEEDEERFGYIEPKVSTKNMASARWTHVEELMAGLQESDWRQAIIEADIMLDDALLARGYQGDGLGERLKQVTVSLLPSLDGAWEAHRVRNRIAHEGSQFKLEERVAHRTIAQYRTAFTELGVI